MIAAGAVVLISTENILKFMVMGVLAAAAAFQINIEIKYRGYIERQRREVDQFKKMEERTLPSDMDYENISGIRIEAAQKLSRFRPSSLGQASRIQGVSPADIQVLMIYLRSRKQS